MKKRYQRRRIEGARHRARGYAVKAITPAEAAYPRADWGMRCMTSGLPDHLSTGLIRVPEGLALTAWCDACGGRYERLVDVRAEDPEAAFAAGVVAVAEPFRSEWIPRHQGCAEAPLQHLMPAVVQAFVRDAEERARTSIGAGETVSATIHLIDTAGEAYGVWIHDIPPSAPESDERRIELAARHHALRELARARNLDLVAAVGIGESWTVTPADPADSRGTPAEVVRPHLSLHRSEALYLGVVTPTAGWMAAAGIHRAGGIPEEGRGTVGSLVWSARRGPCRLLDTVLATAALPRTSAAEGRHGAHGE